MDLSKTTPLLEEQKFVRLSKDVRDLIASTKAAIKEQEQVSRKADAAVYRLEKQLEKLYDIGNQH